MTVRFDSRSRTYVARCDGCSYEAIGKPQQEGMIRSNAAFHQETHSPRRTRTPQR